MDGTEAPIGKRRKLLTFLLGVIGIIAVVLVAYFLWTSNNKPSSQSCRGAIVNGKCEKPPQSGQNSKSNEGVGTNGGSTSSGSTKKTTKSTNSGNGLTNTGPGNVIALFVGTSILSGVVYELTAKWRIKSKS